MQYHKAAFIGSERSKKAQIKLFDYTGFAMLTYTIKHTNNDFQPVGEEMLVGKMTRGDELMLFICDADGYAKAQSKPLFSMHQPVSVLSKVFANRLCRHY